MLKPITVALGATFAVSAAHAVENPFQLNELNGGYMVAADKGKEHKGEGSCGEGSCGGKEGEKGKGEGSCGEGSCGGKEGKKGHKGRRQLW